ncbi:MAG: hypothetical protein GOU97_00070 [Nanoarchaeota archaeon]|nr:hypothetical protein [Nanoarchaeota archaeon]
MDVKQVTLIIILLSAIFLISQQLPEKIDLKKLDKKLVGQKYLFEGNYSQIFIKDGLSIYNLSQGNHSVKLVFFKTIFLNKNDVVEGVVEYYEGELEIIGLRVF